MKVENMTSDKGNKVANQFIISEQTDQGLKVCFQSYKNRICEYRNGKLYLNGDMWDYSNTTRKHFKQFINEYTPFTYEDKEQWIEFIKNSDKIEVV